MSHTDGLCVLSDVDPQGRYQPVVTYNADRSWVLHEPAAYALDVMRVVATAEHDAAIIRTLQHDLKMDNSMAGTVLLAIRGNHARRDPATVLPGLAMTPICTIDGRAVVKISADGYEDAEAPADAIREHAAAALMTAAAAALDQNAYEVMSDQFQMGEKARNFVGSLAEHWPTSPMDTP